MSQAVLRPNLTKKFQWEVSQIAGKRFSIATLLGGLSVNLNHLKIIHVQFEKYNPKKTFHNKTHITTP